MSMGGVVGGEMALVDEEFGGEAAGDDFLDDGIGLDGAPMTSDWASMSMEVSSSSIEVDRERLVITGEAGALLDEGQQLLRRAHHESAAMEIALVEEQEDEGRVSESRDAVKGKAAPLRGQLLEITELLSSGQTKAALKAARAWRAASPGDVLALVALGEVFEKQGKTKDAARVYGSIIDLYPSRADLRRMAGQRLEAVQALTLAEDTYRVTVAQRPDHPSSHRLHAYALLQQGEYEAAFSALEAGVRGDYPSDRFRGVAQILGDDLALIGAAWAAAVPERRNEIQNRLSALQLSLADAPSLRFVLHWETDANDVDLHIFDARGGHAFYSNPKLPSGGHLYADVTTGFGPECFAVMGTNRREPYTLMAHYYNRGPMGYGMGSLQIIEHDGNGELVMETRPFVIMNDEAMVELGQVTSQQR